MALRDGKKGASKEFDVFDGFSVPVDCADSHEWLNADERANGRASLPQVVGVIPVDFSSEQTPKVSGWKKIMFQKTCILAAVFGLGFLASTSIHNPNAHRAQETPLAENRVENEESEGVKAPANEVSLSEDVLGASLKFDAFSYEHDDLYGTGFAAKSNSESVGAIAPSNTASQNELYYDDTFPTWADLDPYKPGSGFTSFAAEPYADAYTVQEPSEQPLYESPTNDSLRTDVTNAQPYAQEAGQVEQTAPVYNYPGNNESFLTEAQPQQPVPDPQRFQNFQPYSAPSTENYDYNSNADYANNAVQISSTNSARYVDESRNSNYNNYQKDNGYSRSAADQNAFNQIVSSSAPAYAEQVQEKQEAERQVPAYVSSIPTFNNPRPEENSRREFVAQTPEDDRQKTPSAKPARTLRW
ncbi:MAG: hypothetical protein PHO46_09725 [Thermoguttaceae bacterium]|nr:hypothetical protein [Thermoguttaceae bacterium]